MEKRLPILYSKQGIVYDRAQLCNPSGKVIAQARNDALKINSVVAMRNFVSSCTVGISPVNSEDKEIIDELDLRAVYALTAIKNLEYLSSCIMREYYEGEDRIEGVYPCPRCGYKIISEKKKDDDLGTDTRDRISDLEIVYMDDISDLEFTIEFSKSYTLKTAKQGEEVSNITMGMPTTKNYINALNSVGEKDEIRLQFAAWADALIKVNGVEVDDNWRRVVGLKLFEAIDENKDFDKISDSINKWGLQPYVKKYCKECFKEFEAFIETRNFFVSDRR